MMRWYAIVVAGAIALPCAGWAELVGQPISLGTELTISQPGTGVTLFHDTAKIDLVPVQYAQVGSAPFDILIERMSCAPERDGIYIRVLDAAALPVLVTAVNETAMLLSAADMTAFMFPPGYGFAADPGALTGFLMDRPTDPAFDQGFNYIVEDRFALRGEDVDTITVASVEGNGRDYLAKGAPFVMLIGRYACTPGDDRILLDLIAFNMDAG
jgi:hypothetical protein